LVSLAEILPFTVSRTIHTQFAVLWIATAWLATGLYIAPAISGYEPKFQKLGVNVLFYALLFIVVGSTAMGWLGSLQHKGNEFVSGSVIRVWNSPAWDASGKFCYLSAAVLGDFIGSRIITCTQKTI
jgi:nitric oxide reductase large subunit